MLVLATIALYVAALIAGQAPRPRRTPFEIPIALFLIAGVVGVFVAPDHRGALGIFRAYLVEPIALYYVATTVLDTEAAIDGVLVAWAAGTIVFSVATLATFAHAVLTGTLDPAHASGVFGINPNSVAIYLEALIAVAVGFALFAAPPRRWIALAVLLFAVPAELATLSRGGLLALGAIVFVAVLTIRRPLVRLGVLAAGAAAALALLAVPYIGNRILHATDPTTGTVYSRLRIWFATFRMLHDHPVFGAGINAYQSVMAPYRAADSNLVPEPYPHNIFLTTWTELGLLGLAAFTWILGGLLILPWRAFRRATGVYRPLLWGVGAAFVTVLVHGMVDSPYWKNDLSVEFWVLAALEIVALRATPIRQAPAQQS